MWYSDPFFYVTVVGGISALFTLSLFLANTCRQETASSIPSNRKLSNHLRF